MIEERPILFNAAMVRALLNGSKTQTRRVVKLTDSGRVKAVGSSRNWHLDDRDAVLACPFGQTGNRLWVQETWCTSRCLDHCKPTDLVQGAGIQYRADGWNDGFGMSDPGKTRVAIFMRRWMSRITLEIVSVRVERLQDISRDDAIAEGLKRCKTDHWVFPGSGYDKAGLCHTDPEIAFSEGWDQINGPGSWDANPYVWVVEFKPWEGTP